MGRLLIQSDQTSNDPNTPHDATTQTGWSSALVESDASGGTVVDREPVSLLVTTARPRRTCLYAVARMPFASSRRASTSAMRCESADGHGYLRTEKTTYRDSG